MVDGDAVGKVIVQIMRENAGNLGDIIAVDGKAIRGTGKKDKAHSFLQIRTAYAAQSGVTLSQEAISYEDKTNEIPVFQNMLDSLDIEGKVITADAMHCQKGTCDKTMGRGGNYAFGLKGNQGGLFEDIKLFVGDPINQNGTKRFETLEKNGGRTEKRACVASDNVGWIPDLPLWPGPRTIFSITRITTAKGKTTEETGFYISSLPNDPQNLLPVVRPHWMIESMHWSLDVIWHEDGCGILSDNGHKTLNAFRKLALLGHKNYVAGLPKKRSIKGNALSALLDDEVAFSVMKNL